MIITRITTKKFFVQMNSVVASISMFQFLFLQYLSSEAFANDHGNVQTKEVHNADPKNDPKNAHENSHGSDQENSHEDHLTGSPNHEVNEHAESKKSAATDPSPEKICAFLDGFTGDIRLLDSTREHSLEIKKNAAIPCGGWVSVIDGYANVRHIEGFLTRLGKSTFVEYFERNTNGGDSIVLFRGSMLIDATSVGHVVQVQTPNARTKVKTAKALILFDPAKEFSQSMAFAGPIQFENRFETSRVININPGEVSELAYGADRVVPLLPVASQSKSVVNALGDLGLYEDEIRPFVADVKKRSSTPSIVYEPSVENHIEKKTETTAEQLAMNAKKQLTTEEVDEKNEKKREESWKKSLLGGIDALDLLEPGKVEKPAKEKASRSIASVEIVEEKKAPKNLDSDREERRKLLEELSKIKLD